MPGISEKVRQMAGAATKKHTAIGEALVDGHGGWLES
jgi:hypothetical protein